MKRLGILIIVCGIIGLVGGYLIFGKIGESYIDISALITGRQDILREGLSLLPGIDGIEEIRKNILLMGAGGAAIGLVAAILAPRGRRRR